MSILNKSKEKWEEFLARAKGPYTIKRYIKMPSFYWKYRKLLMAIKGIKDPNFMPPIPKLTEEDLREIAEERKNKPPKPPEDKNEPPNDNNKPPTDKDKPP